MTTIAYKNHKIAFDSRITSGDLIRSDSACKMREHCGAFFFLCGSTDEYSMLIDLYFKKVEHEGELEATALVVHGNDLLCIGCDDNGLFKNVIDKDGTYALGSGTPFAYTAMDMGATAEQAVEMAAKRDVNTGGNINRFSLDENRIIEVAKINTCVR